ncbi:hypothetical protein GCM10009840_17980 [Pseudolysinimonas kribbensis]|uniref:Uncharacterized protein n=1 Tax=Pseudolysinimonas kribbensis TaxID=433641 RepID=A0ABQ6K417_9MICO|nr:hypothetical protein [Pseudolysinimonas kribbensis]GMA93820.1 hypothetical protein GCM10025881_06440 [Pseudolysinimonas kribbensis]
MVDGRREVLLDTDGAYRTLWNIPGKNDHGWDTQRIGDCVILLKPDLRNGYYRRAVQGWVNGYCVGFLGNTEAAYYQPEILRLAYAGIDLVCKGRLLSHSGDRRALYEHLTKAQLERWVDRQLHRVADK